MFVYLYRDAFSYLDILWFYIEIPKCQSLYRDNLYRYSNITRVHLYFTLIEIVYVD